LPRQATTNTSYKIIGGGGSGKINSENSTNQASRKINVAVSHTQQRQSARRDVSSSSRSSNGSLTRDRALEFNRPDITSYRRNENIGVSSSITNTAYVPSRVSTGGIKYDPIVTKPWD
jgi:hypothetical protein